MQVLATFPPSNKQRAGDINLTPSTASQGPAELKHKLGSAQVNRTRGHKSGQDVTQHNLSESFYFQNPLIATFAKKRKIVLFSQSCRLPFLHCTDKVWGLPKQAKRLGPFRFCNQKTPLTFTTLSPDQDTTFKERLS